MGIITHRKIWISISGLLVAGALVLLATVGLPLGIEFTGGTLLEVSYDETVPETEEVIDALADADYGSAVVQPTDTAGYIIKLQEVSEEKRQELIGETLTIGGIYSPTQERVTTIGPSVGSELKRKALLAIAVVIVGIILFIAYAFRKVAEPVSSWRYGLIAIGTLIHDILITTGVFILFTQFLGAQADTLFVVALLTVLGLSVNDTIVVFDRVRENLTHALDETPFATVVGQSVRQTIMRSINTSASTLLVLFALYVLGPDSTKIFSLTLGVGMIVGTYSSIFLASPLLVLFRGKPKV